MHHIESTVRSLYETTQKKVIAEDLVRVKEVLSDFYSMQKDGSVVAVPRDERSVVTKLREKNLQIQPDRLIEAFVDPENLIFRRLKNIDVNGVVRNELVISHDSLAIALEKWKSAEYEEVVATLDRQNVVKQLSLHLGSAAIATVTATTVFYVAESGGSIVRQLVGAFRFDTLATVVGLFTFIAFAASVILNTSIGLRWYSVLKKNLTAKNSEVLRHAHTRQYLERIHTTQSLRASSRGNSL